MFNIDVVMRWDDTFTQTQHNTGNDSNRILNMYMNIIFHILIRKSHLGRNLFLKSYPIRLWFIANNTEDIDAMYDPVINTSKWEGLL